MIIKGDPVQECLGAGTVIDRIHLVGKELAHIAAQYRLGVIIRGIVEPMVYDYFESHLGNVRTVLTGEAGTEVYAATMEPVTAAVENQLFDNVSTTQDEKPTGFDNPADPNNHDVSKLDGGAGLSNTPRVGPSIVLKVMAGDTITIGTYAWYEGDSCPYPTGIVA